MKPLPFGVVSVGALGLVACSGHPSAPRSPTPSAHPTTTAPARSLAEGDCDHDPYTGTPPAWASENAPKLPFVVSVHGDVVGYLFSDPVRAGSPSPSNKILWYVRLPRDGHPLTITARPRGAAAPIEHETLSADAGPGEIYPDGIDVPTPGCWTLHLTWGTHQDDIDVRYMP